MQTFEKIRSVRKIKSTILIFLVVLLATVGFASAAPLTAGFSSAPTSGIAPLAVQFTDTTTGASPVNWTWNFADGSTSNVPSPSHTFIIAGVYPVNLIVWNGTDTSSVTHSVTVTPLAQFTPFNFTGFAPLTVTFTDTSTGQPNIWLWYFGEGNTSSAQNPSITYPLSGIYHVNLTVEKNLQTNTSANGTMTVNPKADFTITPSPGKAGSPIQFNATSTTGGPTLSYTWYLSSTNTSFGPNTTYAVVNYTYTVANTYSIGLNVTGNGGTSDKIAKTVAVYPVAQFSAPVNTVAGRQVQFTDNSLGDIANISSGPRSWLWDFGDGSTSDQQNPTHIYQPGKFTVTLTVTKNGLSDTTSKIITTDSPNLYLLRSGINGNTYYFKADKYGIPPMGIVRFTAYPTRSVFNTLHIIKPQLIGTTYKWDFYGANTLTHIGPIVTTNQFIDQQFRMADIYTVVLNVTDSRDTYTVTKPRLVVVRPQGPNPTPTEGP